MSDILSRQAGNHTTEGQSECGVFAYGDQKVEYQVVRFCPASTNQKRPKITIKVHPDSRVVVVAPQEATELQIRDAVYKRARWIWQHLEDFQSQMDDVHKRHYISGETYFYLGRRYQLKVQIEPEASIGIKMARGRLEVTLPRQLNNQREVVKGLLNKWYHTQARRVFRQRMNALIPKMSWISELPPFRVMPMQKQWGSCSKEGRLMLNPHLVKAPKDCVDYVLTHELCHIAEHNHSEQFWRLLGQQIPDWKVVKVELDSMAEMYLNE